MAILTNCQSLSKSYSSRPVFTDLTFGVEEGDRIGLIGPNGSGKSSLLKIIAGLIEPDGDGGEVVSRRNLRTAYAPQEDRFDPEKTVEEIVTEAASAVRFEDHERAASIDSCLKLFKFPDRSQKVGALSGGWRKKLALAAGLSTGPDLLLLDEPTNHLDLESIFWLEEYLQSARFSFILISHDRAFLQNVSNRVIELNPAYPQGYLNVSGDYQTFLTLKEEKLSEQKNLEKSLASKVRRAIPWLSRGARGRSTQSGARIEEAGRVLEGLGFPKQRNRSRTAIDAGFQASSRRTKELIVAESISKSFGERKLLKDFDCLVTPGTRLGLVGRNGSGKTTLLKLLIGELSPDGGKMKRAEDLKVVWFEQDRSSLDLEKTLRDSFNHDGDYVVYGGSKVHVATWARRFAFKDEQLNMPISYLSGGEQSKILIANLMLQVADLLILDEPTNDLDIETLETLEDCISEFPGAVVLVSHDRMMLDTVSDEILVLSGDGDYAYCADFSQCETVLAFYEDRRKRAEKEEKLSRQEKGSGGSRKGRERAGLTAPEKRALKDLPLKIEQAEGSLAELQGKMASPEIASNFSKLEALMQEETRMKEELEQLYERWQALEEKASVEA